MPNNKYQAGIYAGKEYTGSLGSQQYFTVRERTGAGKLAGNFEARETVSSGYVRFDQKITDRVELMSGLRIEKYQLGLYRAYL